MDETTQDGDVEMTDAEMLPKEDTTFMVGQLGNKFSCLFTFFSYLLVLPIFVYISNLELKDSIFDDLLNKKKLELLMDPEVMSIFANHQKMVRGNQAK